MTELLLAAGSWLLGFLLHSTLWLGGALLLLHFRPQWPAASRDLVVKGALLGSLMTASLPLLLAPFGFQPPQASLPLTTAAGEEVVLTLPALPGQEATGPYTLTMDLADRGAALPVWWLQALLALWVGGALVGLVRFAWSRRRLAHLLAGREELVDGRLAAASRDLVEQMPPGRRPRLDLSDRLEVPIALGIRQPQVVLPRRLLTELDPAAQRSVVAHELGHLARRDPLWLLCLDLVGRLFWLQPLMVPLRRHARQASEECADAWAAEAVGDGIALADGLTRIAGWLPERMPALAAATALRKPSGLGLRVRRLLSPDQRAEVRGLGLGLGLCAAAISLTTPSFPRTGGTWVEREPWPTPELAFPELEIAELHELHELREVELEQHEFQAMAFLEQAHVQERLLREEHERLEVLQEDLRFELERLHQWQTEPPTPPTPPVPGQTPARAATILFEVQQEAASAPQPQRGQAVMRVRVHAVTTTAPADRSLPTPPEPPLVVLGTAP
jgi:beta-lactamase regulating signal transducer with metallopeptidase domain